MKNYNVIKSDLWIEITPQSNPNVTITGGYLECMDMTIIIKDKYNKNKEPLETKVISFYYGRPNEEDIVFYYNKDIKKAGKPTAKYLTFKE